MMLGDLGADVIKLERPDSGDDTRGWGPPFDARGESAYFLSINRNKRSVAVDLADPDDRALVERLMADADVVVDNFRAGSLERHGLGAARALERFPALVWCTISGFGPTSKRLGYDFVAQAECGWMAITGAPEGTPVKVGVALADVLAGKDATIAVLAALVQRASTGRGQHVTTSLAGSATAALVNVAQNALVTGDEPQRWGNAHANLVPYELFSTADRPIVIAVGNDAQWLSCAAALDLPDLVADVRLRTNAGRLAHRAELITAMRRALSSRPAAHWLTALDLGGVPCGVVKGVLEALREVSASPLTGVAPSVPGVVRRPPPRLNEHGAEIRRSGWGDGRRAGDG